MKDLLRALLREPVAHFVVIGAALFVLDALRRTPRPGATLALAFGPGLTMEGLALSD